MCALNGIKCVQLSDYFPVVSQTIVAQNMLDFLLLENL
jgi:hypothetical protein